MLAISPNNRDSSASAVIKSGLGALRPPEIVMKLDRMGSFHQSRLSFMRILLRRLKRDKWLFTRPQFEIDERGCGHAVYTAKGAQRSYSLVAFAHDLPAEERSDRVIATRWDATFALFDGVPTDEDIERLSKNVPLQEAGRVSKSELSVARANRSVRLFDYVVDCLARGEQPDRSRIDGVGYLMRTTAVYGSGKLGAADREAIMDRPEFAAPFQPEMLHVFLIRAFVLDLVEHIAKLRAPKTAVSLDSSLRRTFGVGNSTGLGMAPFIIKHPVLLNNWILTREVALARVRSLRQAEESEVRVFRGFVACASQHVGDWRTNHPRQRQKTDRLIIDMGELQSYLSDFDFAKPYPWDRVINWAEAQLSLEGQELLASLVLEPYGELVDDLEVLMSADEARTFQIDASMTVHELRAIIADIYHWALEIDWQEQQSQAKFWYVSEEKAEPRLGERYEEPHGDLEQPLSPGRDASLLYDDLASEPPDAAISHFLRTHPQHRHIIRRTQIAARFPYAEIRDNTIGSNLLPIDLLRAKLSFFGACHFDPRSDRWVRINMFRNAPFPHELQNFDFSGWGHSAMLETTQ